MFVMGIDPGLSRCGYGVVARPSPGVLVAVAAGVVETDIKHSLPNRLRRLQEELRALYDDHQPTAVVVERVFFQVNVRTAMSVGQASGLALAEAAGRGYEVAQYTANEVKQAVVGYGSATKDQVQRMVAAVLGLDAPPSAPDAADALALAVCHLTTLPLRRAVEAAAGSPLVVVPGSPSVDSRRVAAAARTASSAKAGRAVPPRSSSTAEVVR